jgi:hypothetical protein
MTCYLCQKAINAKQRIEFHHPVYKSRGGTKTAPTHKQCHREHHSKQGDFSQLGKKAAAKKRWAFHLNNVKTHPRYDEARNFYLMNFASAGWSAGAI